VGKAGLPTTDWKLVAFLIIFCIFQSMHPLAERVKKEFLPFVIKPGRYIGNELNVVRKKDPGLCKTALIYPDLYEIGMSYLGMGILYHMINQRTDFAAERCFAPALDAEKILRENKIPLFSLETFTPLKEFYIVGFSLSYELTYTNVLNILDLAGIPIHSAERTEDDPLVIAGGSCASNPEPMADFIDIFVLGDGEEIVHEILDVVKKKKSEGTNRKDLINQLSKISGVYVPSFYEVKYDSSGNFEELVPQYSVSTRIFVRTVPELKSEYYPSFPLVPFVETTHDRLSLEIMRGCPQGCRFCQAGILYRPKRERPVDEIVKQAEIGITNTGWDEVSLVSLSSTDYRNLKELVEKLQRILSLQKISISLPSMRPGSFSLEVAQILIQTKKTGLTFAPEAGTQRLRDAIRKNIKEEDLLETVAIAYSSGWNLIKLYFMIGLPTETLSDLDGIIDLIKKVLSIGRKYGGNKNLNVAISPFVPKAHTPFQWEELEGVNTMSDKIYYIKSKLHQRNLSLKFRDPEVSFLEGILGRGDRKIGSVIYSAWKNGARLDAWTEHFNYDLWRQAFEDKGIDMKFYSSARKTKVPLPWDFVDKGIRKETLLLERERAFKIYEEDISTKMKLRNLSEKENIESVFSQNGSNENSSYGRKKKKRIIALVPSIAKTKIRMKWSKGEEVRFTSHLDVIRMFERAIRRSGIPIAYSFGFHPHLKIAFGPPLPLGFISDSEYLDIQLDEPYTESVFHRLSGALPSGFKLLSAKPIFGKTQSLSSMINSASYMVSFEKPSEPLEKKIEEIVNKKNLMVKRIQKDESKLVDIRYNIFKLEYGVLNGISFLKMLVRMEGADYVRPEEILAWGLGWSDEEIKSKIIKREGLYIIKDEQIKNPMDLI
jgi:radical SAM family uncharacterized protein/radical SAM-linked protein